MNDKLFVYIPIDADRHAVIDATTIFSIVEIPPLNGVPCTVIRFSSDGISDLRTHASAEQIFGLINFEQEKQSRRRGQFS